MGHAVNVMAIVFGNLGMTGDGRMLHQDLNGGEKCNGEFS